MGSSYTDLTIQMGYLYRSRCGLVFTGYEISAIVNTLSVRRIKYVISRWVIKIDPTIFVYFIRLIALRVVRAFI